MRNNNNDGLPREHQGQEQIGSRMQHQGGQEPPYLFGVGPINAIPLIEGEYGKKEIYKPQYMDPPLFGEDQFKDGLGPVYATPTVPWQGGPMVVDEAILKGELAQQQGGQAPPVAGQGQHMEDVGPIYAIPTVPWAHGQGQGDNHWQQWGGHPKGIMPCCMCCQVGHLHYR